MVVVVVTPGRYVVLHHTGYGEPHFDLMLSTDAAGPLLTWRCPVWPPAGGGFTPLPPHRREYLNYEGPVSRGRGEVRRVDAGDYRRLGEDATSITIEISGRRFSLPRAS